MKINLQLHSIEQRTIDASIDEWRAQLKTMRMADILNTCCRLICVDKQKTVPVVKNDISKRHL